MKWARADGQPLKLRQWTPQPAFRRLPVDQLRIVCPMEWSEKAPWAACKARDDFGSCRSWWVVVSLHATRQAAEAAAAHLEPAGAAVVDLTKAKKVL